MYNRQVQLSFTVSQSWQLGLWCLPPCATKEAEIDGIILEVGPPRKQMDVTTP